MGLEELPATTRVVPKRNTISTAVIRLIETIALFGEDWRTFLFYNAIGGGVWTTVMVLVGYFLGDVLGD